MTVLLRIVLALVLAAGFTPAPASAGPYESFISFHNTSDAGVWVSAYSKGGCVPMAPSPVCMPSSNLGAWCVGPGKTDTHGIKAAIYEVRAEVGKPNCAHPIVLNKLRGFPYDNGKYSNAMTYYIHGSHGKYVYDNTP